MNFATLFSRADNIKRKAAIVAFIAMEIEQASREFQLKFVTPNKYNAFLSSRSRNRGEGGAYRKVPQAYVTVQTKSRRFFRQSAHYSHQALSDEKRLGNTSAIALLYIANTAASVISTRNDVGERLSRERRRRLVRAGKFIFLESCV